MITVKNISKTFGIQTIYEDASLQINAGDRFCLVGPNGSGKSTLFKMLLGETEPDQGEIQFRRGATVGYLPQENPPVSEKTVLEGALENAFEPDGKVIAKAKTVLMGLGFKIPDFDKKISALSGGWAMRVAMARLLLDQPDLLMLDEPTNHLDLESLFWFQEYLKYYPGAIFLISHDRAFINALCKTIVSVQNRGLKAYHGNYDDFVRERQAERERLEVAYREQQEDIEEMQEFISRNRARASTASRAQSMIKRLEKLERIALPESGRTLKIRFPQPERTGVRVLTLKNLCKSYGDLRVYDGLDFELERGWKVAFVGQNGAGKSTLLKVLAGVIPFDSGERNLGMNVKVGYFAQHRMEGLDPEKTVLQEAMDNERDLSEELVRTVLGSFLFPGESVFKKISVLSGGEKSRVALVKLLLDPPNVLLMDEPTTHLDMASVDALIQALKDFEGTLCCISHDLYFINSLADHVVHVDRGRITVYPGNYEYFERRQKQKAEETQSGPEISPGLPPAQEPAAELRDGSAPEKPGRPVNAEKARRAQVRKRAREIENLNSEIARLREQVAALQGELADPSIYSDYQKAGAKSADLGRAQQDLAEREKRLGELAAEPAQD